MPMLRSGVFMLWNEIYAKHTGATRMADIYTRLGAVELAALEAKKAKEWQSYIERDQSHELG